jgi:hypothetical protein
MVIINPVWLPADKRGSGSVFMTVPRTTTTDSTDFTDEIHESV